MGGYDINIIDKDGEMVNVTNNALDVSIQDQNTDLVDYMFCRDIRTLTIASTLTLGAYVISVVSATNVLVGSYICIQEGKRAFQAKILSIVGNDLTLDTPIDYPFTPEASIAERSPNMNVDGSTTPISFVIAPKNGVTWDICRVILQMVMSSAGTDALFGNLTELTKGIVLRKTDGIHHTIFNAKTNGDLALRMYDITYTDRATPSQTYGLRGRRSFNGFDKNGVVIRLDGDNEEKLELLVQDNLSALTSFRIVAQGHVVE